MKENTRIIIFIIGLIIVIFMAYVANTYEEPQFIITEKNISIEDLSASPFMDHTNDIENYVNRAPVILSRAITVI